MKMEEITTEKEFIAYMKPYGTHVDHALGDYYHIRKLGDFTYVIGTYREKHSKNTWNTSLMQEEEATATECVELIKKECVCIQRKKKLQKIKNG